MTDNAAADAPFVAPPLTRRLSQVERDALGEALQELSKVRQQLVEGGLSPITFFLGLSNICLCCYLMGAHPEHFWLVYSAEAVILIGIRMDLGRRDNTMLYFLDFCWVMNVLYALFSLLLLIDAVTAHSFVHPSHIHVDAGAAMFVIACGPLGWSVIAMSNALVLHDVRHTSASFIHLMPCITCYSLKWNEAAVSAAWPNTFDSFRGGGELGWVEVWSKAAVVYAVWWVLFTTWMMLHGRFQSAKKTGQHTVYEYTLRTNKPMAKLFGIKDLEKEVELPVNVIKYMLLHAVMVLLAFANGVVCIKSQTYHLLFCLAIFGSAMYQGSNRYYKIMTRFYVKKMEALLEKHQHKGE